MFFESYKFNLKKMCFTKTNTILFSVFLSFSLFMIWLLFGISLTKDPIYGFQHTAFIATFITAIFFTTIINIILTYKLYIESKRNNIMSLEIRSNLVYWKIFFTRFLSIRTITFTYIIISIFFYFIGLYIFKPLNFNLLLKVTPGLFALLVYDLLCQGITLFFTSFGNTKFAIIPMALFSIYVGFAPAIILIPSMIRGQENYNYNDYYSSRNRLEYINFQQNDANGLIANLIVDFQNDVPIFDVGYNEIYIKDLYNKGILKDKDISVLKSIYLKYSETNTSVFIFDNRNWYLHGLFDSFFEVNDSAINSLFDLPDSDQKIITFNENNNTRSSLIFMLYEDTKQILSENNFEKQNVKNSLAYSPKNSSVYYSNGGLLDTINFLTNKNIYNEIMSKLNNQNFSINSNYNEWISLLSLLKTFYLGSFYYYNLSGHRHTDDEVIIGNEILDKYTSFNSLQDDYWGLNLLFEMLYKDLSSFLKNNSGIDINGDVTVSRNSFRRDYSNKKQWDWYYFRFNLSVVFYNMFYFTNVNNVDDYMTIYGPLNKTYVYNLVPLLAFNVKYDAFLLDKNVDYGSSRYHVNNIKIVTSVGVWELYLETTAVAIATSTCAYFIFYKKNLV